MDITIVIPVLNRKALLKHTLDSIMRSPMNGTPVIVVDNGSTDGTLEMLETYTAANPCVAFVQEPQRSAAAARNKGLSMVHTKWVYFFDSDDEFEDIPHSWNQTVDMVAFPTRQMVENKISVRAYKPVADPAVQILNSMLNTISMIFRTSWLKDIGSWNTSCRVWDDWELGIRALMAKPRLQWITDKAYHTVKIHPESLTGPSFKSRYKLQLEAIGQAFNDSSATDTHTAKRCFKALMLRTYILSGKLLHEGDKKASSECRHFIMEHFGKKPTGAGLGRILEQYTAMGGRGAWKIALHNITRKRNL